jgi:hypothetical protein
VNEYPSLSSGKSVVAEHSINVGHCIQLHDAQYMDRIVKGEIEIELRPHSMNRKDSCCLTKSRKPLVYSLKDSRASPKDKLLFGVYKPGPYSGSLKSLPFS